MTQIRGNNIVCGISTTGTGTITCDAIPAGYTGGGVDPYTAFSGMGFGTTNAIPVGVRVVEYTDATFTTELQSDSEQGQFTIGANLAACTIARTTILNKQVPGTSYTFNAPTALSIGTAANTLVFFTPMAELTPQCVPWFDATSGDALGITFRFGVAGAGTVGITSGTGIWCYGVLEIPILLKKMSARVVGTQSGTTNVYARVYAIGSNGRAGKLLADMGLLGTANSSLAVAATITSAALSTPVYLCPGPYCVELVATITGGAGTPTWRAGISVPNGGLGTSSLALPGFATSTGETSTANDPASFTAYAISTSSSTPVIVFQNA